MKKQLFSIILFSLFIIIIGFTGCDTATTGPQNQDNPTKEGTNPGNPDPDDSNPDKPNQDKPDAEKTLSTIIISQQPYKLSYEKDDTLDLSGLIVKARYSDGSESVIDGWSSSPAEGRLLTEIGDNNIIITYQGKTTSFTVNVVEKNVNAVIANSYFWGIWVRMDNGSEYEILETRVEHKEGLNAITDSTEGDKPTLTVEGMGTFTKQSDSVMVCNSIPYFRKGGSNLEYSLKLVGFASQSRAAGTDFSGITGKGKSSKYKNYKSDSTSDSEGNIKFTAPTVNDTQTVEITNGNEIIVVPGLKINNNGDKMGTVAIVGEDDYNLKITGTISDDQKDNGYLYGNNTKTYDMVLSIKNISKKECSSSICTIEPDDPRMIISSSTNLKAFTISTLIANGTKNIDVNISFGEMTEPYIDTGLKVTLRNKSGQKWEDYVPLRFYKGLIPITVSAKSTEQNDKALNGFIIYPDGNNQFFTVEDNTSKVLFVPTFEKDKKYKMVFSGATVTAELSESTEMYYSVSPGSTKEKKIVLDVDDPDILMEYMNYGIDVENGVDNQSEENAYNAEDEFIAYLSNGEIDYYNITADSEDFYTPNQKNFYRVNFDSKYGEVPSTFYAAEDSYIAGSKLTELEHDGMTFLGWYIGNTKIEPDSYKITHEVTLTAKWELTVYPVEYELNGGKNASDNPYSYTIEYSEITLKNPSKDGYKFAGWYSTQECNGEAVTAVAGGKIGAVKLYAKWFVEEYKIEYELNGGTNSTENPAKYNIESDITFAEPIQTGYKFAGWYESEDFSSERVETIEKGTSWRNIKLYAKWEIINYKIDYELYGGQNNSSNPATYTMNTPVHSLAEPQNNGYNFKGWYLNDDFSGIAVTTVAGGGTGEIKLYAKWEPVEYTITYELNGGTNDSDNPSKYTIESPAITFAEPSRTGYKFMGWYGTSNYSGSEITGISSGSTDNVELFAEWQLISYSVEYTLNGGTIYSANPANYTIESASVTLNTPVKTGYDFKGWFTNASFSGTAVETLGGGETGIKHFYAKWDLLQYNIEYELNGGTNSASNPSEYTIESPTITFAAPTRTGYDFMGWYTSSDFSGNKVTSLPAESTGNITLYARWKNTGLSVTVAPYSDISIAKTQSGTLITFTADDDYTNYKWYVDSVAQTANGNTFSFETSSLAAGVYTIYLEAKKSGKYYSSTIDITVGGNN